MKKLYLLRHANAVKNLNESDLERKLDHIGIEECGELSQYLNNVSLPELIICSEAIRTKQTLNNILSVYQKTPQIIYSSDLYNASSDIILEQIFNIPDKYSSIMVIGHNPGITKVGISLSAFFHPYLENFEATAKLMIFEIDTNQWKILENNKAKVLDIFIPTRYR